MSWPGRWRHTLALILTTGQSVHATGTSYRYLAADVFGPSHFQDEQTATMVFETRNTTRQEDGLPPFAKTWPESQTT